MADSPILPRDLQPPPPSAMEPPPEAGEEEEIGAFAPVIRALWLVIPACLMSLIVHTTIVIICAAIALPIYAPEAIPRIIASSEGEEPLEDIESVEDYSPEDLGISLTETVAFEASEVQAEDVQFSDFDEPMAMPTMLPDDPFADSFAVSSLTTSLESSYGSELSGRGAGKGTLVAQAGGSEGSERAVAMALRWLAAHQCPDGGWDFDLKNCPNCQGKCKDSGDMKQARNAATALALLPFLGAGHTHKKGDYQKTVRRGLHYLTSRMKRTRQGGSFFEPGGRMYSHGLCSIAVCEAYAMTRDRTLFLPAQECINYIVYAQDPVGGGWRYEPREEGDTSVVGWQLMALKSGNMAVLRVPKETLSGTERFLTSVQADGGALYGYMSPEKNRPATTAIGLLCRMYMGWKRDEPALERGVQWLSKRGPSPDDSYYNYYATQVLRHYGGEAWDKWNRVMRDQLVESQETRGHEAGSWHFPDDRHGHQGGRLYSTAMSTMILEVYYRHLPIYRSKTVEDDFELD